ncbi:hypothetical protein D9M68_971720 [compost metagenome]
MDIWKDLRHARSFREGWDVLFKPPGAVVTAYQREQEALAIQDAASLEAAPALQVAPAIPDDLELEEQVSLSADRQVG